MAAKKYVCKVCGYVHEGNEAPSVCPVCKVGASEFEAVKEAKKGLDTNSDVYAIIYSAVVVVIVAFLLAGVSSLLKPRQDDNIRLDKKKQILASLNIKNVPDAAAEYDSVIKSDPVINASGEVVKDNGGFEVANDAVEDSNLPLYIAEVDGEKKSIVIDVNGKEYVLKSTGRGSGGAVKVYLNDKEEGEAKIVNYSDILVGDYVVVSVMWAEANNIIIVRNY